MEICNFTFLNFRSFAILDFVSNLLKQFDNHQKTTVHIRSLFLEPYGTFNAQFRKTLSLTQSKTHSFGNNAKNKQNPFMICITKEKLLSNKTFGKFDREYRLPKWFLAFSFCNFFMFFIFPLIIFLLKNIKTIRGVLWDFLPKP